MSATTTEDFEKARKDRDAEAVAKAALKAFKKIQPDYRQEARTVSITSAVFQLIENKSQHPGKAA